MYFEKKLIAKHKSTLFVCRIFENPYSEINVIYYNTILYYFLQQPLLFTQRKISFHYKIHRKKMKVLK